MEKLKQLLIDGYITEDVVIAGMRFTLRSLSAADLVLLTAAKEYAVRQNLQMSEEMFRTLDTILKVSFALVSIDGEAVEPTISPDDSFALAPVAMGLRSLPLTELEAFIQEKVLPRVNKLLKFPPQLFDKLVEKWNALQDELNELIEKGDIKNSSGTLGSKDTSTSSTEATTSEDTEQTTSTPT